MEIVQKKIHFGGCIAVVHQIESITVFRHDTLRKIQYSSCRFSSSKYLDISIEGKTVLKQEWFGLHGSIFVLSTFRIFRILNFWTKGSA